MIEEGTENVTFENFDITRIPTLSLDDMVAAHFTRNLTQSECIQSRGRNIRFNRINTYKNYGIGFYFVGVKSYNIAYRCDSYNNSGIDSATKGNADGFGAHGTGALLNVEHGIILMIIMIALIVLELLFLINHGLLK